MGREEKGGKGNERTDGHTAKQKYHAPALELTHKKITQTDKKLILALRTAQWEGALLSNVCAPH